MQNQIWLLSLKVCSITKELQWSNPNHEKVTTRQVYFVHKQRRTRQQARSNPKNSGWTQWLQLFFHLWRHLVMHSYLEVAHHFGWCKERFYSMDTLFAKNFANIHVIFSCLEVTPNKVGPGSSAAKPSYNKHWMCAIWLAQAWNRLAGIGGKASQHLFAAKLVSISILWSFCGSQGSSWKPRSGHFQEQTHTSLCCSTERFCWWTVDGLALEWPWGMRILGAIVMKQ